MRKKPPYQAQAKHGRKWRNAKADAYLQPSSTLDVNTTHFDRLPPFSVFEKFRILSLSPLRCSNATMLMSTHPSLSDEYSLGLAASSAMSKATLPISTHPPLPDAFSLGQSATEWTPQHIEFLSLKEVTSLPGMIPVQVSDDDGGESDPDVPCNPEPKHKLLKSRVHEACPRFLSPF
jgi:hypothetical protein